LIVYVEYFDKELEKDVCLRSAPLFLDVTIEEDESVIEITAEETPRGIIYALKGDIDLNTMYGYNRYSDDTPDFDRGKFFGFTAETGGLIYSMESKIFDYADIQRFYDFVFDGDTAYLKMTLPKTVPINIIDDFDDYHEEGAEKAPAEDAYLEVFKAFYSHEWLAMRTGEGVYHISVDLENVLHEQPELIKAKIEEYLKDTEVILLWEKMASLIEQGYIYADETGFPGYFENGSLFVFNDSVLTDVLYETKAHMWYGNLGAQGAAYKVRMRAGKWEITSITGGWIS
jgi:hypothetical protein